MQTVSAVDLALPRYACLHKAAYAEETLREHLHEHHAEHGALPTLQALLDRFGGGKSRMVRIRHAVEVELGLRHEGPGPRRAVGRLQRVTTQLTGLGETLKATPAELSLDDLATQLRELQANLERRESQVAQALAGVRTELDRLGRDALSGRDLKQALAALGRKLQLAPREAVDTDRLDRLEGRIVGAVEKLQAKIGQVEVRPTIAAPLSPDVPPAWARQSAVAATSALDGRLQSLEESVRDAATGARAAYELAADVAREVAAAACAELQRARSGISAVLEEDRRLQAGQIDGLAAVKRSIDRVRVTVESTAARTAAVSDRRAAALRDVIIGMTEIEMAQVEMLEAGIKLVEGPAPTSAFSDRKRPKSRWIGASNVEARDSRRAGTLVGKRRR